MTIALTEVKVRGQGEGEGKVSVQIAVGGTSIVSRGQFSSSKEAYSSLCYKHRTATGTHVSYGITQCYLPPGRGDIPAITPAN